MLKQESYTLIQNTVRTVISVYLFTNMGIHQASMDENELLYNERLDRLIDALCNEYWCIYSLFFTCIYHVVCLLWKHIEIMMDDINFFKKMLYVMHQRDSLRKGKRTKNVLGVLNVQEKYMKSLKDLLSNAAKMMIMRFCFTKFSKTLVSA